MELASARPYEIAIEVSENDLRRFGLTFDQVAAAVRQSSLDLPGGSVRTTGGEILLRTKGQAYVGSEFEELVLLSRPDGTHIRLGDVANVVDGFAETDQFARFDGHDAVLIQIYRTGDQAALTIAAAAKEYLVAAQERMPAGVHLTPWQDASKVLKDRLSLLLRNGAAGFVLVFISLSLFLRFRLAFWVSLGIPISFLGAIWLMPHLDVSVNLISLFAFIVVLGIVVDDAIVAGENIYTHQQRHRQGLKGSIDGAKEVATPVIFAVLTTVAAFLPLLNVEGAIGKVMRTIPLIVIPCLLFSLVESLWILPAHLSHMKAKPKKSAWRTFQSFFADGMEWYVRKVYTPSLDFLLRWRYITVACGIATLLITIGIVRGGYIRFEFFPPVEADYISAALTMPEGTPADQTSDVVRRIEASAFEAQKEFERPCRWRRPVPPCRRRGGRPAVCRQPAAQRRSSGEPDLSRPPGRGHHRAVPRRGPYVQQFRTGGPLEGADRNNSRRGGTDFQRLTVQPRRRHRYPVDRAGSPRSCNRRQTQSRSVSRSTPASRRSQTPSAKGRKRSS